MAGAAPRPVEARKSFGLRALIHKNFTLQMRQKGMFCCQLVTPLLVMLVLLLLEIIINSQTGTEIVSTTPTILAPLHLNQLRATLGDLAHHANDSVEAVAPSSAAWPGPASAAMLMGGSGNAEAPSGWPQDTLLDRVARGLYRQGGVLSDEGAWEVGSILASLRGAAPEGGAVGARGGAADDDHFLPLDSDDMVTFDDTIGPDGPVEHNRTVPNCLEFFFVTLSPAGPANAQPGAAPLPSPAPSLQQLDRSVGGLQANGSGTGLLGFLPQLNCTLKNGSWREVPYMEPVSGGAQGAADSLFNTLEYLTTVALSDLGKQPPCADEPHSCPGYLLPDGTLDFHDVDADLGDLDGSLAFTLSVNDALLYKEHRGNNFTRLEWPGMPHFLHENAIIVGPARIALIDSVTQAFAAAGNLSAPWDAGRGGLQPMPVGHRRADEPAEAESRLELDRFAQMLAASGLQSRAWPPALVELSNITLRMVATFPVRQVTATVDILQAFASVLFPIALGLQLPLFIFVTVLEKETGLLEMQKSMGMKEWQYYTASYALNLISYCILAGFFWLTAWAMGFSVMTVTNPLLIASLLLSWGLALTSFAAFMASILSTRELATVVGYVVSIFGALMGIMIADGIYGNVPPFSITGAMPQGFFLFPPFALCRAMYLVVFSCVGRKECMVSLADGFGGEVGTTIGWMLLDAVIFLVLSLYLEQVMPRKWGVPREPLFCIRPWLRHCSRGNDEEGDGEGRGDAASSGPVPAAGRAPTRAGAEGHQPLLDATAAADPLSASAASHATTASPFFADDSQVANAAGFAGAASATAVDDEFSGHGLDSSAPPVASAALSAREAMSLLAYARGPAEAQRILAAEDADVTQERRYIDRLLGLARGGGAAVGAAGSLQQADDPAGQPPNGAAVAAGDNADHHAKEHGWPLVTRHLRKVYRSAGRPPKVAVDDLSLHIRPGETLGLLGENGCGKTTTISMLTGTLPPSGGDAWVSGNHVVRETPLVHMTIGLCPQHDRLWEDLTCEEHLLYYARLKGVGRADEAATVERALLEVRLLKFKNRRAGELSGGMKRRLSVAISLVGGSKLVLLDEPSTGLDPASRRQLWRIIDQARRSREGRSSGRSVVLTTHAMDEADLLCTRVAIATHGRVRVIGTQQRLKRRFGQGYRVTVGYSSEGDQQRAEAYMHERFPSAVLDAAFKGFSVFILPLGGQERVSGIFEALHADARSNGISYWAVGQVSLEDVFARVVRAHQDPVHSGRDADQEAKVTRTHD